MSKLTRQDFYCGAGLAILFRKNEHISPSIIENVNDIEGKNVVGTFYKIKTQSGNEAIIYIKFSSNQQTIKNLTKSWKFSLTDIEKDKINKQVKKNIPFFIILVCAEQINRDNIFGEIALLTVADYEKISHRSNIILGLWSDGGDESKTERQKVYVLKVGKGNSRGYYCDVKRNQIETPLDNLIYEFYPKYTKLLIKQNLKSDVDPDFTEPDDKIKIYVTNEPKVCIECKAQCTYDLVRYLKSDKAEHKINTAICPKCNRKYIGINFYNTFIKGNKNSNISFEFLDSNKSHLENKPISGSFVRCLLLNHHDDNVCPIHNNEMSPLYVHIGKLRDTAYYCDKCNRYMIPKNRYIKLLKDLDRKSTNMEFEAILDT